MKVLVASPTTDARPDDFSWTLDGELLHLPAIECSSVDRCGCERSFAGSVDLAIPGQRREGRWLAHALTADLLEFAATAPSGQHPACAGPPERALCVTILWTSRHQPVGFL